MLLEEMLTEISNPTPPTYSIWAFYTEAFKCCDYKFKVGTLRISLSENTFAGHWETVVDCMENIGNVINDFRGADAVFTLHSWYVLCK